MNFSPQSNQGQNPPIIDEEQEQDHFDILIRNTPNEKSLLVPFISLGLNISTIFLWLIVPVAFGPVNGLFIFVGTILVSCFLWGIMEFMTGLRIVIWIEIIFTLGFLGTKESPVSWLLQGIQDWFSWFLRHFQ
jgi:hypothetical protein